MKYLGVPLLAKRLGIKDFKCLVDRVRKKIWRTLVKDKSLWSVWVNLVKLKSQSFWDIAPSQSDSWGWKFLLKLGDKIEHHIGSELVNGSLLFHWINNEGKKVAFSTQQVWLDLRINRAKVNWLSTQDKMLKWMPNQDLKCAFCGLEADSINHLFFQCNFCLVVWEQMKQKLSYKGLPNDLQGLVQGICRYPAKRNIWSILNRLVVAACVYHIWQERNNRIFKKVSRKVEGVCNLIQDYIKCKLLTFKVKQSSAIREVEVIWDVKWLLSSCVSPEGRLAHKP
ncbi:uncharacterized protein [Rutidosis leptorrhynchoides]|uniref:uncharacterized protein n=1 Tax=Rutidosis leptorrhynchoides TaxID=125765 RepID=UPI003A99D0F5